MALSFFFPEFERDLGEIPVDPKHRHAVRFSFENRGDSLLRVLGVTTTCGCVHPTLSHSELAPGAKAELGAEIERPASEQRAATITIRTNDPIRPVVRASLSWKATAPVTFEPVSLEFADVVAGQAVEHTVLVVRHSLPTGVFPDVGEPRHSAEALNASWLDPGPAGDVGWAERQMLVRVTPGQDPGDVRGQIELRFDDSRSGIATLPVQWRVRKLVEASPAEVFLGSGRPGERRRIIVVISTPVLHRLAIKEVALNPACSELDVSQKTTTDQSLVLQLDAQLPAESGEHKWELKVSCLEPVESTVIIPITAHVSKIE